LLVVAEEGLYRPLWSETILAETRKALIEQLGVPESKTDARLNHMRDAFPQAVVTGYDDIVEQMANHPKDRHVLAAAVKSQASVIVTDNLSDFPATALSPHNVAAVSPDTFLLSLLLADQEAVCSAVERKRAAYQRPPRTIGELCAILSRSVPRFADRLLETAI